MVFDGIEFVWIPPGEFQMGSTSAHADSDEQPLTRVRLTRGFWMGKYEVTQDQWEAVMGNNPSRFNTYGGDFPVERVSWEDAQDFIGRLNGRAGGGIIGCRPRRSGSMRRGRGRPPTPTRGISHNQMAMTRLCAGSRGTNETVHALSGLGRRRPMLGVSTTC